MGYIVVVYGVRLEVRLFRGILWVIDKVLRIRRLIVFLILFLVVCGIFNY